MLTLRSVNDTRMLLPWFLAALGATFATSTAEPAAKTPQTKLGLFETRYRAAEEQHSTLPSNATIAMAFAAASFDRAELAVDSKERAHLAKKAIEVCRRFVNHETEQAAANTTWHSISVSSLAPNGWGRSVLSVKWRNGS